MGSVVISIDAELGWGFHDMAEPPRERVEHARWGWKTVHSLLDEYEVPATWAVVGHLMLDDCDGVHEDHPAPPGWFGRERGEWFERRDLRFAPDLVTRLVESPVAHELASHSFSHVLFADGRTTGELARAECRRARAIAADWGLSMESFVFPRNGVAHRDALLETGFSVYRGPTTLPEGASSVLASLARGESLLVEPRIDDHGLVDVPASVFVYGFEGALRRAVEAVWRDPMVTLVRRGIDQAAAAEDGLFHIWLHPNNLVSEADAVRFERILEYIEQRRSDTDLRVETMAQAARRARTVRPDGAQGETSLSRSVQQL